jgi:hypothetical protein
MKLSIVPLLHWQPGSADSGMHQHCREQGLVFSNTSANALQNARSADDEAGTGRQSPGQSEDKKVIASDSGQFRNRNWFANFDMLLRLEYELKGHQPVSS